MIEQNELNAMIEEATQALPGRVSAESELGALNGWDSMGLVIFIDLVHAKTGVELQVHDLRACARPPDILALIRKSTAA
jgi:acyl carrier protein